MDPYLAELYNTADNLGINADEESMDKLAAAELVMDFCKEANVDPNTLSDDDVVEIYNYITSPEQAGDGGMDKLAEADMMGRAMAHAYVAEMTEIQKQAGIKDRTVGSLIQSLKNAPGRAAQLVREAPSRMAQSARAQGALSKAKKRIAKGAAKMSANMSSGEGVSLMRQGNAVANNARRERRAGIVGALKGAGIVGGGAAALGGAGYGGYRALRKESSLNEDAVALRALEMLEEAGYDLELDKTAGLDEAALDMLEAAGYQIIGG